MTDTALPFPFRFPEPDEDITRAGLCQECLNAPIVQTPCPHSVTIPMSSVSVMPATPEEGEGKVVARPATNEPSMKGECEVCGLWAVEHEDKEVGHQFTPIGKTRYIADAKR